MARHAMRVSFLSGRSEHPDPTIVPLLSALAVVVGLIW